MPVTILSSHEDDATSSSSSSLATFKTEAAPFGIEWTSSPVNVEIVIADPPFLCELPDNYYHNTTTDYLGNNSNSTTASSSNYPLAYLVQEGGDCSWEEKATIVEELGGQYLILFGNGEGFPTDYGWLPYGWGPTSTYNGSVGALLISGEDGASILEQNHNLQLEFETLLQEEEQQQQDITTTTTTISHSGVNGTTFAILGDLEGSGVLPNNTVVVPLPPPPPPRLAATLSENYGNAFSMTYSALPMVITMKITGGLSFLGSTYIACQLLRKRRRNIQDRNPTLFLLFLSVGDMVSSACLVVGTWAIPSQPYEFGQFSTRAWHTYFPGASGNHATCVTQGFFFHLGAQLAGLSTGCIAIQNLLRIKYRWTYDGLHKLEKIGIAFSVFVSLGGAIGSAAMDLFNPIPYGWCWINEYPMICNSYPESSTDVFGRWCELYAYGKNDNLFRFVFTTFWIGTLTVTICGCMATLFCWVRKNEKKAARWSTNARNGRAQKQVLWKAMCYLTAFLGANSIASLAMFQSGPVVDFLMALLYPLQGFLNVLIYSNILDWMLKKLNICQPKRDTNAALPLGVRPPTEATVSQVSTSEAPSSRRVSGTWSKFMNSVRSSRGAGPPPSILGLRRSALRRAGGDIPDHHYHHHHHPSIPLPLDNGDDLTMSRELGGGSSRTFHQGAAAVCDTPIIIMEDPIPEEEEEKVEEEVRGCDAWAAEEEVLSRNSTIQQRACHVPMNINEDPIPRNGGSSSTPKDHLGSSAMEVPVCDTPIIIRDDPIPEDGGGNNEWTDERVLENPALQEACGIQIIEDSISEDGHEEGSTIDKGELRSPALQQDGDIQISIRGAMPDEGHDLGTTNRGELGNINGLQEEAGSDHKPISRDPIPEEDEGYQWTDEG